MTTLTCPKCRHGMPDEALDAGQCPACGFPLDGPMVLGAPAARGGPRVFAASVVVLALCGLGGYGAWKFSGGASEQRPVEVAHASVTEVVVPAVHIAPFPHEPPRPVESVSPLVEPPGAGPKDVPPEPQPQPIPLANRDRPRPVGVVMKVDPKIAPIRTFDHPNDTAALPDLNSGDAVVLRGRLRVLRIGAVNGKGSLDASALVAEEIVIGGDISSEAVVKLNAPGGNVTIRGFVFGNAKLTVAAPGGAVMFTESARMSGGPTVTVTARQVELKGRLSGGAKVNVTLTAGGSLKLTMIDEGAVVTYRKSAPGNSPVRVEKGIVRGGARVVAE